MALAIVSGSDARSTQLSDRHQAICRGDTNYRVVLTGVARDRETCASRNACFSYTLRCGNTRQYALTWYLNPRATEVELLYAENYPYVQIALAAVLLLYTAIACVGGFDGFSFGWSDMLGRWGGFALIAFMLFVSNVPGTHITDAGFGASELIWTMPTVLFVEVGTWAGLPLYMVFLLASFFRGIPKMIAWLDYMLRRHPAEPVVLPALRRGRSIDVAAVADAIMPRLSEFAKPPPAYKSENQAKRARALKRKLQSDAKIAEATEQRERARAALIRAERAVEEAKRNTGRGRS